MSLSSPVASVTALALIVVAPAAFGQTDKETQLEARIVELEKQVLQMTKPPQRHG